MRKLLKTHVLATFTPPVVGLKTVFRDVLPVGGKRIHTERKITHFPAVRSRNQRTGLGEELVFEIRPARNRR